jgi:hypothetical protein
MRISAGPGSAARRISSTPPGCLPRVLFLAVKSGVGMFGKNTTGATPAKPRRASRRGGKKRSGSRPHTRTPSWIKAVDREIKKREAEKSICIEGWRASGWSEAKLERAWNQYQLRRALGEARYERGRFRSLSAELNKIVRALAEVDQESNLLGDPKPASNKASDDRRAAISALHCINNFLQRTRQFHSRVLHSLLIHLTNVENGARTPELFEPSLSAGRKSDSSYLQSLKGYLGGIAFVQMEFGMSRDQAASWLARKIPPDLSQRISSKPIRSSTIKEWMAQYGTTARIRRELKAIVTLEMVLEELVNFTSNKYQSGQIDGSFGELACLRMMYFGHKCLIADHALPFTQLFSLFREERVSPVRDQDTQARKKTKDDEVRRLFGWETTTQLARLYFLGELNEGQLRAGEVVAQIYGQFDSSIAAPRRQPGSPHYESAYKQQPEDET